jgi:hypothetical protein
MAHENSCARHAKSPNVGEGPSDKVPRADADDDNRDKRGD